MKIIFNGTGKEYEVREGSSSTCVIADHATRKDLDEYTSNYLDGGRIAFTIAGNEEETIFVRVMTAISIFPKEDGFVTETTRAEVPHIEELKGDIDMLKEQIAALVGGKK